MFLLTLEFHIGFGLGKQKMLITVGASDYSEVFVVTLDPLHEPLRFATMTAEHPCSGLFCHSWAVPPEISLHTADGLEEQG